jgi:hypothetical protein
MEHERTETTGEIYTYLLLYKRALKQLHPSALVNLIYGTFAFPLWIT